MGQRLNPMHSVQYMFGKLRSSVLQFWLNQISAVGGTGKQPLFGTREDAIDNRP